MKNNLIKNKCNLIKYLVIISIILLICYSFRLTTIFDENYSLVLSHNSFTRIIELDSLDVHPPLYYFLLKIFLNLTTLWTTSFFVKVIFARILSVIFSLITFYFLYRITKIVNLHVNVYIQWLLFLIIPGVISFTYQFIKIRMYALGAMFVIIEFYELIEFNDYKKYRYLIYVTLSAILAFYTNYYAAFIAGIMLLIYMFRYLLKYKHIWINIFISGVVVIIAFLPWLPVLMKQLTLQNDHTQGAFVKQWLATLILMLLFVYPLLWSYKHLNSKITHYFLLSFFILLILFTFMTIVSMVDQSVFAFRYVYPIYLLYSYFGINIMYIMFRRKNIIAIGLIFISILGATGAYVDQFNSSNLSAITMCKQFNYWHYSNKKYIYLKPINNGDQGFNVEKAMYLSHIHRKFHAPENIKFLYNKVPYRNMFSKLNKYMINR